MMYEFPCNLREFHNKNEGVNVEVSEFKDVRDRKILHTELFQSILLFKLYLVENR